MIAWTWRLFEILLDRVYQTVSSKWCLANTGPYLGPKFWGAFGAERSHIPSSAPLPTDRWATRLSCYSRKFSCWILAALEKCAIHAVQILPFTAILGADRQTKGELNIAKVGRKELPALPCKLVYYAPCVDSEKTISSIYDGSRRIKISFFKQKRLYQWIFLFLLIVRSRFD